VAAKIANILRKVRPTAITENKATPIREQKRPPKLGKVGEEGENLLNRGEFRTVSGKNVSRPAEEWQNIAERFSKLTLEDGKQGSKHLKYKYLTYNAKAQFGKRTGGALGMGSTRLGP